MHRLEVALTVARIRLLARVRTAALWGRDAFPVDCEADVGPGLPGNSNGGGMIEHPAPASLPRF